jgi:translation initiation factor IF-3
VGFRPARVNIFLNIWNQVSNCILARRRVAHALYSFYNFYNVFWRCFTISSRELQLNEKIHDRQVRVIGPTGAQLGLMSSSQALQKAEEMNLDLVKIAPQATPPVCKIIDYGKYRFEQAKREKEARKNQHIVEIKEIRLSLNIDTHDFNTKVGHAQRFLKEGDKVKVSIRFRGREMGHPEQGHEIMKRFAEALADLANVEKPSKMEGRNMLMFLASKPVK